MSSRERTLGRTLLAPVAGGFLAVAVISLLGVSGGGHTSTAVQAGKPGSVVARDVERRGLEAQRSPEREAAPSGPEGFGVEAGDAPEYEREGQGRILLP